VKRKKELHMPLSSVFDLFTFGQNDAQREATQAEIDYLNRDAQAEIDYLSRDSQAETEYLNRDAQAEMDYYAAQNGSWSSTDPWG
jgi:hypothetical protein